MTASSRQGSPPTASAVRVSLTGVVSLTVGGTTIAEDSFPGRQGRLLFARLVLADNAAIPRDELAELLWPSGPPATWEKALSVLVSKLRALLAESGLDAQSALVNVAGCYRLDLPEGTEIDVEAAEQAARASAAALVDGETERALALGLEALAVARRPFLADSDGAWVESVRRELADLADEALACATDSYLAAGRSAEAVRMAQEAVALQPFRESGHRRLMQAHAAAGNRAEGLRAYDRCRHLLADELGAYPSPETEAVFQQLLKQPEHAAVAAAPEPVARALIRRRRGLVAGVAIGAAGILAVVLLSRNSGAPQAIGANSVAAVDAGDARLSSVTAASERYAALGFGRDELWAVDPANSAAVRLDTRDGSARDTVPVGDSPAAVTAAAGSVWVANSGDGTVSRVDPRRGTVVQTIPVGNGPAVIAADPGGVWVGNRLDSTVARIDPHTGKVIARISLPSAPTAVAVGTDAVWVSAESSATVFRIDPATNSVVGSLNVGHGAGALTATPAKVWVTNAEDRTVAGIDARRNAVTTTIVVGGTPTAVAAAGGKLWVARTDPPGLDEFDAASGRLLRAVKLGGPPNALALVGSRVWISTGSIGRVGGTLRLVANPDVTPTLDPALVYDGPRWALMVNVYDGLTAFRRSGGTAGTTVVPDLARSLPGASDGGLTYGFELRRGLRYSNGSPVRARDFAHAIERLFELRSPGAAYFSGIRGAGSCRPGSCDLRHGIVTSDARGTVVFHLTRPDPEFIAKLALPFAWVVPAATPARDVGTNPTPGTGPYRIARFLPRREITLARNPRFRVWSPDAQPAGNPDVITMKVTTGTRALAPQAIAGADIASGQPDPVSARRLLVEDAARVRTHTQLSTVSAYLNTRVPPFDDARVRRAVNFAADRRQLSRDVGAPLLAQTTCQALPPGLLGYYPYCPYTSGGSSSGVWRKPDIGRARRLVRASGKSGAQVIVLAFPQVAAAARDVAAAMNRAGLHARVRVLGAAAMYNRVSDSRYRVQAALSGWVADYPTALGFLFANFDCKSFVPNSVNNTNLAEFCDRRSQRAIDAALATEGSDVGAAGRLWHRADQRITDAAPVIAFANPRTVDVISRRVENYKYSPIWGALLDQVSLARKG